MYVYDIGVDNDADDADAVVGVVVDMIVKKKKGLISRSDLD